MKEFIPSSRGPHTLHALGFGPNARSSLAKKSILPVPPTWHRGFPDETNALPIPQSPQPHLPPTSAPRTWHRGFPDEANAPPTPAIPSTSPFLPLTFPSLLPPDLAHPKPPGPSQSPSHRARPDATAGPKSSPSRESPPPRGIGASPMKRTPSHSRNSRNPRNLTSPPPRPPKTPGPPQSLFHRARPDATSHPKSSPSRESPPPVASGLPR